MDVQLIDTTFRDGSQSLWAMGMSIGMMEAVAAEMDQAGFMALEVPASATFFKKFVRDLKEDPWENMRRLARCFPKSEKAAMGGGFVRGFELPPPAAIKLLLACLARTGALNRVQIIANTTGQLQRTFPWIIPFIKEQGFRVSVALSYTISPRHTDEYYAEKTRAVLRYQPDAVYLKDQGGLLTPERVRTLIPTMLAATGSVPLELHSHCTTGLAPLVYQEAVDLGITTLHTAVPPLANGSSQPSVFNVARNLRLVGHTPMINEAVLKLVAERLTAIARQEKLPVGVPLEYDHGQFVHQVPGGVISNLRFQLAELGLAERLDEVLAEVVTVRKDLGYPIMITPYSQFMVTQAAINIAVGERYRVVIDEVIQLALGVYGEDSGHDWMDPDVRDRILARPRARELAAWEAPDPTLREMRAQYGGPGVSDEELILRYLMKGDQEIAAMRAAGPPKQYTGAGMPLAALLDALHRYEGARYIHVQKGSTSLVVRKRAPA